jgi:rhodanese-related sulfurtransferase/DNA-binding transcriptional ArsR family regulator
MIMEREWKDQLYQELARIGKCLSSPKRLELLELLSQAPKSVDKLSKASGMSVANVSQHLQTLYEARLVRFTKRGNHVIYELADMSVAHFLVSFRGLSEKQLVEIQHIKADMMQSHKLMEPISMKELKQRMEKGEVLLVDVRPREEYDIDHIPGAISIPYEQLENELHSLPKGTDIVAYCRGPYCLASAQAAELLRSRGYDAFRLEEGVLEWKQQAKL